MSERELKEAPYVGIIRIRLTGYDLSVGGRLDPLGTKGFEERTPASESKDK